MTNKEAIEKLKEILFMTGYKEALDLAIKALEERPQGEWITKGYEPFGRCNVCNGICEINNFCGACGADMRGKEE